MCRISFIVLLAFMKQVSSAQDSMDDLANRLVDKLVNQGLKAWRTHHAVAKIPRGTPYARAVIPYKLSLPGTHFLGNIASTRSTKVWTQVDPNSRASTVNTGIPEPVQMAPGGSTVSEDEWEKTMGNKMDQWEETGSRGNKIGRRAADVALAVGVVSLLFPDKLGELWSTLTGAGGDYRVPAEIRGLEVIMAQKAHGTSSKPVQPNLRWGADGKVADQICSFNRNFAEFAGYFTKTSFLSDMEGAGDNGKPPVTFYDSVTGKPLFVAPQGRSWDDFVQESKTHGWPSFRDNEVVRENVRVLPGGETVSADGTHLGHNLPDFDGRNRYCINLVSIAGRLENSNL